MQAEALKEIRTLILAADTNRGVPQADAIITQEGESIVKLEEYRAGRARFRGAYKTNSVTSLAEYVKGFGGENVSGFVDPDSMSCKVFINLGTKDKPGHGDHSALLALRRTAFFSAALAVDGKQMSQKAVAEWLEDWSSFLITEAGTLTQAINAVRKIKIEAGRTATSEVGNLKATKTALEQIEASSDEGLPSEIIGLCRPFDGLELERVGLRLSVIANDDPKIVLRIVAREALIERIADQFAAKVRESLSGMATVVVGSFTP